MTNKNYELIIKNGYIIDGSGNPWYKGDIGIKNGKIANIDFYINEKEGYRIINAKDLFISPGFIDLHTHTDINILAMPYCESAIMQGVTTAVAGNCGWSMAPINPKYLSDLQEYFSPFLLGNFDYGWKWSTLEEYYQKVEKKPFAINLAPLVAHGTIRIAVKGFSSEPVTVEEINKMKYLLRQSLQEGAFGMSTGLAYPPGCYATTEELVALGDELKNFGRLYASHIRNESRDLIDSVQEAIKIGRKNKITIQISHLKAKGKSNWGKVSYALKMMEQARTEGLEIGCDVYPYLAGSTTITSILPNWLLEGGVVKMLERLKDKNQRIRLKKCFMEDNFPEGNDIKDAGFEGIFIASSKNREYEGFSISEIIKRKKRSNEPFEVLFDLILELKGNATVNKFITNEEDMQYILTHPLSAIVTDSWATKPNAKGKPHPRTYGTFPRVLGKYVREKKLMRLEEAIRKMTSYPASIMRIKDRGLLRQGYWADITIFNPDTILDQATYQNPHQYPLGISYVIVNGKIAVDKGNLIQEGYGKVLRAK